MKDTAKNRILPLLLALALTLGALAGCGGQAEQEQPPEELPDETYGTDTLPGEPQVISNVADNRFALNFDPDAGTNPVRANSATNMMFWSLLYDSVYAVDENFNYSSDLVTDVRTDDFIWWVFDIRTDVCFSDGTPLTAHDVVYSILRGKQSDYYRERLKVVYGISALDDGCFAITAGFADSMLPARLNIPIIPKDTYFEDYPVGSGPYRLNDAHSALVVNEYSRYADELPLETVYLRNYMDTSSKITAFEDARIDLVTNDPTGRYNLGYGSSNERRYYDTTNMHFIGFNAESMYFQSFRMRYALGLVIDRQGIVDDFMNGYGAPATLPVHPRVPLYDETLAATLGYRPDKAASLFEAAGVEDLDNDGYLEVLVTGIIVELDIKFIVNTDSTAKVRAARRICQKLNDMGITTTLYELTWENYIYALSEGDYDLYYGEIRMTPDWDLSPLFHIRESGKKEEDPYLTTNLNYANVTDRTYAELYAAYLAAPEAERAEAFGKVTSYIAETAIILPICFERREVLTHRGVVSGIEATQYDAFYNFTDWTINLT